MMGGGLCWLDYDGDGWLDLYVVNGYAESDIPRPGRPPRPAAQPPLPQRERPIPGRHRVVRSRPGGPRERVRGRRPRRKRRNRPLRHDRRLRRWSATRTTHCSGTTATGRFTEGAWQAGIRAHGWHTGAAVADVNADGRLDVFVAGYTDPNNELPGSEPGFPANHAAVRDLLYLNVGGSGAHPTFREVGRAAGLEPRGLDHGLGALVRDVDRDGRARPLRRERPRPEPALPERRLRRRRARRSTRARLPARGRARAASTTRTPGWASPSGDYSGDGLDDLFVTNSRGQLHAAYESRDGEPFADVRPEFTARARPAAHGLGRDLGRSRPRRQPRARDRERRDPRDEPREGRRAAPGRQHGGRDVRALDVGAVAPRNGRGLAAADYDNDGDVDLAVGSIGGRLQLLRNDGADGPLARSGASALRSRGRG